MNKGQRTTHGIANKGFSGMRNIFSRFNFGNGDTNEVRNPLLAIP